MQFLRGPQARRTTFALVMTALAWGIALTAQATVMVELPLEQLVADSELIVHGTVLRDGTRVAQFDGHLEPHTVADLRVDDVLRGQSGDVIEIDELGGETPTFGTWIEGTPRYRRGDEVIVFLRRLPNGSYRTVGMAQGRFDVMHTITSTPGGTTTVRRDTSSLAFASWVNGQMVVRDGSTSPSMDYAAFVASIRSIAEQLTVVSDDATTGGAR